MISRVAESCFWLGRYIQRLDSLARLTEVNRAFLLDVNLPEPARWRPQVIVIGEEETFARKYGATGAVDPEDVQSFFTWDADNVSSMHSSLGAARENARTIRETISLELWIAVNELWLWFGSRAGRQIYQRDRSAFYREINEKCLLFQGLAQNTMLHDEALAFMTLGTVLERAEQTARILDVKYHGLGPTRPGIELPLETAQWLAILRSCLGVEAFSKRAGDRLSGAAVAEFLLFELAFPHSVLHNLTQARTYLASIRQGAPPDVGERSAEHLDALLYEIAELDIKVTLERGLHVLLTEVVERTTEICNALYTDFFDPARSVSRRSGARRAG